MNYTRRESGPHAALEPDSIAFPGLVNRTPGLARTAGTASAVGTMRFEPNDTPHILEEDVARARPSRSTQRSSRRS